MFQKQYLCISMNIIMKKAFASIYFLIVAACFSGNINAAGYFFYIQLTDKNNSPYSLSNPSSYLSERAIERRAFFNVPVDSTDLPVNPQYLSQLTGTGVKIHCTTKWLNGVTVMMKDTSAAAQLRLLPFVKYVQYTGITQVYDNIAPIPSKVKAAETDYGVAAVQLDQMNGRILHQNGYKGENMHIAVLDAGFRNVNTNPAFNILRNEGRVSGTKDFVNPYSNIYLEDAHGAYVLSTMAAELEGTYVGTAPEASYLLIRTESAEGEYLCEPDFWVSGIEYADSAGVDLATTSLGYTTFDDSAMNYTYAEMNGKTARASIAATMAFKKGIMLLNAAGNDGNKTWKYIGVPGDAEGVITVGSVRKDSVYSTFSSIGPSADGRIKPELAALGTSTYVISTSGSTANASGTSFATPVLAGITACYLQASKSLKPHLTLPEIQNNLFKTGHLYNNPTAETGYGIPDFQKAFYELTSNTVSQTQADQLSQKKAIKLLIDNSKRNILIKLNTQNHTEIGIVRVFSLTGQIVSEKSYSGSYIQINTEKLEKGIYLIQINTER